MGKGHRKIRKLANPSAAKKHKSSNKQSTKTNPVLSTLARNTSKRSGKKPKDEAHIQLHPVPLPISPTSKILLLGEGDFSFSASLALYHECTNLTCTTFESRSSLLQKHPESAEENLSAIASVSPTNKMHFSVDATKLGLPNIPGGAELRKQIGTYDTVWFNFPHVGGKSKDVNRQVRANQALVVGFLEGAKRMVKPGGAVVTVLFDGMPYELWGVRNLARHVDLRVERSGRFDWQTFPGYMHKRTMGDVDGGGGWKGEDREARVYIFRKDGVEAIDDGESEGKKRKRDDSDSDNENSD